MRGKTIPDVICHLIQREIKRNGRAAGVLFTVSRIQLRVQLRHAAAMLRSFMRKRDPEDPYALVAARTRPRLPRRGGAVAVDPYEY